MDKEHILAEIRRTADENGGLPLGKGRFLAATGIRESDWSGRYWVRWSDAVREAGYQPNALQAALADDELLLRLAGLTRELGHFPVAAELRLKARQDPTFPSHNTFRRFGGKARVATRLLEYCVARSDLEDVSEICAPFARPEPSGEAAVSGPAATGFVYLIKAGRFYKIGRTNSMGRRERELAIQLPERPRLVHSIKTDDPHGIERYWHDRFADRRKNGEWFELSRDDVAAFRRRRYM